MRESEKGGKPSEASDPGTAAESRRWRPSPWVFLPLLILATAAAYLPTAIHYAVAMERPDRLFAGGVLASGNDSYFWLRAARELQQGEWDPESIDPLRDHPDGRIRGSAPWISRLIAAFAHFSSGDPYRAALWFQLGSVALFVVPLGLYCWRVGFPAAGLLAGMLTAWSLAYRARTSIHRIDTDAVNLFWLCALAWLFSLVRPSQSRTTQLALSVCGGLVLWLFVAWYARPEFWLALLGVFAASLLAARVAPRRVALLLIAFAVAANPLWLVDSVVRTQSFVVEYLWSSLAAGFGGAHAASPLTFESISARVAELTPRPLAESLSRLVEPVWLAAAALLVSLLWWLRCWRVTMPLAALLGLGLLGLFVSRRFLMYLAPFVGIGLGVTLALAIRALVRGAGWTLRPETPSCVLAFGLALVLLPGTAFDLQSRPLISTRLLSSLQRAELPAGAVVWHSWGLGFVLQDVLGAATFNDGLRPDPVIDHLLVRGVTSADPRELQRIVSALTTRPRDEVASAFREERYAQAMTELLRGGGSVPAPVFLLFTPGSMTDLSAFFERGQWDFERGEPGRARIQALQCTRGGSGTLRCRNRRRGSFQVNLLTGEVGGGLRLDRVVEQQAGLLLREGSYNAPGEHVLELTWSPDGRTADGYLVGAETYASNLNQLYFLGRADPRYFELVYDDFPRVRLYRVRSCAERDAAPDC